MQKFILLFIVLSFALASTIKGQNQINLKKHNGKAMVIENNESVVVQFITKKKPKWYYKTPLLYKKGAKGKNVTFVTGKITKISLNSIVVETSRKDKFTINCTDIVAMGRANRTSKLITSTVGIVASCNGSLAVMVQTGFVLGAGAFAVGVGVVGLINKAIFPVVRLNDFGGKWKFNVSPKTAEGFAIIDTATRSRYNKGV